MKTNNIYRILAVFTVPLILTSLLLSACNTSTNATTTMPTAELPLSTEGSARPTASAEPTEMTTDSYGQGTASVSVDISGLAQDATSIVVASVTSGMNRPYWEVMPEHTLVTLQSYLISNHLIKPQIFVYPVEDLGVNEAAVKIAVSLQSLLENQEVDESLPFLPLYNAMQVMHAQVKFLDFQNGKGVRFLTQYDQAMLPINNHELLYAFQGLTKDNKYYVAAVMPINLPGLPAHEYINSNFPPDFLNDFPKYLTDTVSLLNQQPAGAYTPDLTKLDAMIQSLEVK